MYRDALGQLSRVQICLASNPILFFQRALESFTVASFLEPIHEVSARSAPSFPKRERALHRKKENARAVEFE